MAHVSVGVDPGLRSPAIAVVVGGAVVRAVTLRIGSSVRGAERLSLIREKASRILQDYPEAHAAAIEGPSLASTHREYDLGEASGVLRQLIYEIYRVESLVVPPTSLKKYATGNGGAGKDLMIQYAVRELGARIGDDEDDAADAAALAHLAHAFISSLPPSTRHAAEVLKQLRQPSIVRRRRTKPGTLSI